MITNKNEIRGVSSENEWRDIAPRQFLPGAQLPPNSRSS